MGDFRLNLQKLYIEATTVMDKWFWAWWKPSDYEKIIIIPKTVIYICGSEEIIRRHFKRLFDRELKYRGIGGLKTVKNGVFHVFVVSEKMVNPVTLGHEMTHVLNSLDRDVINPDLLNKPEIYKKL